MWNWLGIISSSLFLILNPEVSKISHNHYSTILDEDVRCGQIDEVHYCISKTKNSSSDIIYFFPGILHNEYAWLYQRKNFTLRKVFFHESSQKIPIVITISVNPFFMVNPSRQESKDIFLKKFPEIERLNDLRPKERIFYGNSLGSFNAFEFAMMASQILNSNFKVKKLIMGCPMIPVQNPFSDFKTQKQFFLNMHPHTISFFIRFLSEQLFLRFNFSSILEWQKADPLRLASENNLSNFPDTLITGGENDEFHFMDGAKKLDEIFEIKKMNHLLDQVDGSHCTVDLEKIANFILN